MPVNSTEKWNKLCDYFESYRGKSEDIIQVLWEKLFSELFDYSSLDDEIETHRKLQLGSTERLIPDIIIKNRESDLFIVELKREELAVDESRKSQLFSYLKQTQNDLGILICDRICLIDFDYNLPDEEQKCCCIDFSKDNPLGIKFMELFDKYTFSKEAARSFIDECIDSDKSVVEIAGKINSDLLKQALKEYLMRDYDEANIDLALSKYAFSVEKHTKRSGNLNPVVYCKPESPSIKDSSPLSDNERLIRDINTVGKETFIKYFEYYNDPAYETRDIRELFIAHEKFKPSSMASKASTGKGIIRRGMAKEALKIISDANISIELRQKAQQLYNEIS